MPARSPNRCEWAASELMIAYHDGEWGVPVRNDRELFELLTLEGAQAGLSWETILKKRDGYRAAFADFDLRRVARFDARKIERLLQDAGIVRNRLKIESTVANARVILATERQTGSFADYLWSFVEDKPIVNRFKTLKEIPAQTALSKKMSKDMRERGFRFVGPTICYAFMQAAGMVNDHLMHCFRHPRNSRGAKGRRD